MESVLNTINNRTFYRYYPSNAMPFRLSYEDSNKYGFGIYFLDNTHYYSNQYPKANIVSIIPNLENPKVFEQDGNHIPNSNYVKELVTFLNQHKDKNYTRNDFNEQLRNEGYDSLVIYEPRGIYLVLLKTCSCLYTIIDDKLAEGGTIKPLPHISASRKEAIKEIIAHSKRFTDLTEMEATILYNNFKENKIITETDVTEWIWKIIDDKIYNKGYLDYENWGEYQASERGQDFIDAVEARYQTRYNLKKGYDLFPEHANIAIDDKLKNSFKKLYNSLKK